MMNCTDVVVNGVMLGFTGHSGGYLRTKLKILTTMDPMHKVERTTGYRRKSNAAKRNSTMGLCRRRKVRPKKPMAIT